MSAEVSVLYKAKESDSRHDDRYCSRQEDCEEPPPVQMSDCLDIMEQQKKRMDKTFRESTTSEQPFFVSDQVLQKATTKQGDKWGRGDMPPTKPMKIQYQGPAPVIPTDGKPDEYFESVRQQKHEDDEFQKECRQNYKRLVQRRLA